MAAQTDKLTAHVNGVPAGYLSPSPDSPKYVFTYFPEAPSDAFVSLMMPVRAESYVWQEGLHPIFQMNLPEGYQKDLLRQIAKVRHPSSRDAGTQPEGISIVSDAFGYLPLCPVEHG